MNVGFLFKLPLCNKGSLFMKNQEHIISYVTVIILLMLFVLENILNLEKQQS